jgi:histidinol dehydrogenase
VLAEVRSGGEKAILKFAKRFDGVSLQSDTLEVTRPEIVAVREQIDSAAREAVHETHKRVVAFAKAGMKEDWRMSSPRGGILGEQFRPIARVGVYVPGGAAPLVSTALMTVTLAKVAGVPEIVVCTPCGADLKVNPVLLHALEVAGATEVYRVGGIQAIGLMAYGTRTIAKVLKIVGPGGTYVTAAKRQVYGQVALDLVAGPSEIAVLADETANPRFVAADMLSQAEHGTGHEKALLVTTSGKLAHDVQAELTVQSMTLSRQEAIRRVMDHGMLIVIVNNLDEGMELCNRFAPEHLEIMVREPRNWLLKVTNAGAVFVGSWSPESAGDFVAGPSHVLPTGGAAAMFSGLTVDDFRKRTSVISFTRADLQDALPTIESFGRVEGLDAHARSARMRFEKP